MSADERVLWWEMDWAKPSYSRSQVDRAGVCLAKRVGTPEDIGHAVEVMNNWRASHSYPLNTFQMTLRNRARKIYPHANPVQRLKRAVSIETKLEYNPSMRLSRMQDIAGCRAIMPNVLLVDRLANRYMRSDYHQFVKEFDYIREPKGSGYRGIHLTYLYVADDDRFYMHDGQSVEIQLRSAHQHA
jgi:ppGpp synthetase/RelA/SpoT-type nucleotidyltranferase